MSDGIFNPFEEPKKPKKNFLGSTAETPLDTEFAEPGIGDIRLDGGAYVIILKDTDIEEMEKRLGSLIEDMQKKHPEEMLRNGIKLLPLSSTYQAEDTETILKTPSGLLIVYIGTINKEEIEDEAFRRLGYTLLQINDLPLLEEHNTQILSRR